VSGFSTRAIHAGEGPDPATGAHTTPIYQTATFSFETAVDKDAAVDAGMGWEPGAFFYSRTANPTTAALEAKLADLEGAEEAVVGASGMAALSTSLLSLLEAGDHLVVPTDRFVITRFLVEQDLPRLIDAVRFELDAHGSCGSPFSSWLVLRGGEAEMRAFADALELCSIAVSLGDFTTLVYPQPRRDNLIRISVGCEDADDLAADFERGPAAAAATA